MKVITTTNNQNFKNINNQNFNNKEQHSFSIESLSKIESKIKHSNSQANSQIKSTLSNKLDSEKIIPNTKSKDICDSDPMAMDYLKDYNRKRDERLDIDHDKKKKIEAILFGASNDDRLFVSYEYFSAACYVYNFNEKYSEINNLIKYKFESNEKPRLEQGQKCSEAKKEYEAELRDANLNENEMIEIGRKLNSMRFGSVLLDDELRDKMDDFEKYERISTNCGKKMNQSWEEYFKKRDDNHIEYAKKLFEFFDAEENQELINEFLSDVMIVMELKKNEEYEEMILNKKSLDEIKATLKERNPNFAENEILYDLNSLYHALVAGLENKILRSVL